MNYTIIGHTEDSSYHDRCGDYVSSPGAFEKFFFRDHQREEFVKTWAKLVFDCVYEDLVVLLNGVPDTDLTDDEDEEYYKLVTEREALHDSLVAERAIVEQKRKDEAAEAALAAARYIAAQDRARDEKLLADVKKRLGLS